MRTEMKNKIYKKLKDKIEKQQNIHKRNSDEIRNSRMRAEINKQQTKRTIVYFNFQEREKKEKGKQSTTINNMTTTRLHAPHYMEKDTMMHPLRWWMTRFGC